MNFSKILEVTLDILDNLISFLSILFFMLIVPFFLYFYLHSEISVDDYANVKQWIVSTPQLKDKAEKYLEDNKITHMEYGAIKGEYDSLLKKREIDSIKGK